VSIHIAAGGRDRIVPTSLHEGDPHHAQEDLLRTPDRCVALVLGFFRGAVSSEGGRKSKRKEGQQHTEVAKDVCIANSAQLLLVCRNNASLQIVNKGLATDRRGCRLVVRDCTRRRCCYHRWGVGKDRGGLRFYSRLLW